LLGLLELLALGDLALELPGGPDQRLDRGADAHAEADQRGPRAPVRVADLEPVSEQRAADDRDRDLDPDRGRRGVAKPRRLPALAPPVRIAVDVLFDQLRVAGFVDRLGLVGHRPGPSLSPACRRVDGRALRRGYPVPRWTSATRCSRFSPRCRCPGARRSGTAIRPRSASSSTSRSRPPSSTRSSSSTPPTRAGTISIARPYAATSTS